MASSLCGLVLLSRAGNFGTIIVAAALIGIGSSVFHPEASRIARAASGGRHGFAQSLFQVGGYSGSALGPLLAAFVVVPHGQHSLVWFSAIALVGIIVLATVGHWYSGHLNAIRGQAPRQAAAAVPLSPRAVVLDDRRPDAVDLLEVCLHGEPVELLHLLPDREIRCVGQDRADVPVRLSWCDGGRDLLRRSDRRPVRTARRDLGLDPRRPAAHVDPAPI